MFRNLAKTLSHAFSHVARLKRERPNIVNTRNREHEARVLQEKSRNPSEAEKLAARIRGYGASVTYGWDAAIGPYAEVVYGSKKFVASRLGSIVDCLQEAAKQVGLEVNQ